jgi:hypothetical protein
MADKGERLVYKYDIPITLKAVRGKAIWGNSGRLFLESSPVKQNKIDGRRASDTIDTTANTPRRRFPLSPSIKPFISFEHPTKL